MTDQKIKVLKNGPYLVRGYIPLVRKSQISSEYGEPMTWQKTAEEGTRRIYALCRCGQSGAKPYCDGSHRKVHFDGTETARTDIFEERKIVHSGSTSITIKRDYSICAESGFCGSRKTDIRRLARETDEPIIRAQLMAMIDHCPSGSYTYSLSKDGLDIEADLPRQVAVTTEMTSEGPIQGSLWVTGSIEIERADGKPMEARNRVTLCRCGHSRNKPLCDGTHRAMGIKE